MIIISRIGKLKEAGYNINDEYYTPYNYVEKELCHYEGQLNNKIIYCNCDDYTKSNFFLYFKNNFDRLGLKKLMCSCYNKDGYGTVAEYTVHGMSVRQLCGDGDFRSDECVDLLKESDVVITNPPFSIAKELLKLIINNNKEFLMIWNMNAITYKEVFPLLRDNVIRIGYGFNDSVDFIMPHRYKHTDEGFKHEYIDSNGVAYGSVKSIAWFTNLEVKREIKSKASTNNSQYEKYDNYDAINVNKVKEIPNDYYGIMGVPITYIGVHDKTKFKIIGLAHRKEELSGIKWTKDYSKYLEYNQKGEVVSNIGKKINGNPVLKGIPQKGNYFGLDGDFVYSLYSRIFIERINSRKPSPSGEG